MPNSIYHQSGVIPYRFMDDDVEILLITSRRKNRWGIPKGIVEEGMSEIESAQMEAYEEAGVVGEADEGVVGEYRYRKWDGLCHVKVYLLRVTSTLEDWPESRFRSRRWERFDNAVALIRSQAIRSIIRNTIAQLRLAKPEPGKAAGRPA